jgi:hypothetical protein
MGIKKTIVKKGLKTLQQLRDDVVGSPVVKQYSGYHGEGLKYKMSEVYGRGAEKAKSSILHGGGTTASWTTTVPTKQLTKIKGGNDEHLYPKLMEKESVKWLRRGDNATKAGPPQVTLGPRGEKYIYEGNTRSRVLQEKRVPFTKVSVGAKVHGERTITKNSDIKPRSEKTQRLMQAVNKAVAKPKRGGKPMKGTK